MRTDPNTVSRLDVTQTLGLEAQIDEFAAGLLTREIPLKPAGILSAGEQGALTAMSGLAMLPPVLGLPDIGPVFEALKAKLRGVVQEQAERSVPHRVDAALQTLDQHNLRGSFLAHAKDQLRRYGKIYVGVIDNFNAAETSHGLNVARRLKASVPDYLRAYIEVVPFDIGRGRTDQAFRDGIRAAANKDIVALSVSLGLDVVNKEGLERRLGVEEIDAGNRQRAFWTGMSNFNSRPDYEQIKSRMMGISSVSRSIPVVTPVWNDGSTTLAAIAGAGLGGPIVTSIEETGGDTHRTEAPGMVDFYSPVASIAGMRNGHTSQSAPYFIGQILGGISEQDLRQLLRR